MKEKIYGFIGLMICIGLILWASYMDSTRTITATVYRVDNNKVVFEDYAGDLWDYESEGHEFKKHERVVLTLNTMCTHEWQDDEIIQVTVQ